MKIRFESVVASREPYFLEPADTRGLLRGESLTPRGPPLGSISREELCRAYGGVAYLRQRWISYSTLRDRRSTPGELIEKALSRAEISEVRVGEWPRIVEEVAREVRGSRSMPVSSIHIATPMPASSEPLDNREMLRWPASSKALVACSTAPRTGSVERRGS